MTLPYDQPPVLE